MRQQRLDDASDPGGRPPLGASVVAVLAAVAFVTVRRRRQRTARATGAEVVRVTICM